MLKAAVLQAFLDVTGVRSAHSRALLAISNINLTIKTINIIDTKVSFVIKKKVTNCEHRKNCMM